MYRFSPSNFNIKEISVLLFPLGLWVLLWLSLNSGNLLDIYHPTGSQSFIHGIRAAFPLLAALLSTAIILTQLRRQRSHGFLFLGPLGLAAIYGIVGVIGASASPNASKALYWSVLYLSVPTVLWASSMMPMS